MSNFDPFKVVGGGRRDNFKWVKNKIRLLSGERLIDCSANIPTSKRTYRICRCDIDLVLDVWGSQLVQ